MSKPAKRRAVAGWTVAARSPALPPEERARRLEEARLALAAILRPGS
ncbi:hypothetical protein LI291_11645 [Intestinibacillus massiliensis]|nr:hypothetical protein [Intestinibacillus massiliensis]